MIASGGLSDRGGAAAIEAHAHSSMRCVNAATHAQHSCASIRVTCYLMLLLLAVVVQYTSVHIRPCCAHPDQLKTA
mgnify:CR=1 FL=1